MWPGSQEMLPSVLPVQVTLRSAAYQVTCAWVKRKSVARRVMRKSFMLGVVFFLLR